MCIAGVAAAGLAEAPPERGAESAEQPAASAATRATAPNACEGGIIDVAVEAMTDGSQSPSRTVEFEMISFGQGMRKVIPEGSRAERAAARNPVDNERETAGNRGSLLSFRHSI